MNRRVSGFTLVEVVISLAILAIAFFGLISVITYTTRMNMATRERMLAMRAAEKKIEQMLGCTTLDEIYNTYCLQQEGLGWEQVEGLDPVYPAPVALPSMLPPFGAAVPYPTKPPGGAVLFVRFPPGAGGGWSGTFDEKGTGQFMENKDDGGNYEDLDLNQNKLKTDGAVALADCKILPVRIEVYWRGIVGPQRGNTGNTSLIYRYTFLRKN